MGDEGVVPRISHHLEEGLILLKQGRNPACASRRNLVAAKRRRKRRSNPFNTRGGLVQDTWVAFLRRHPAVMTIPEVSDVVHLGRYAGRRDRGAEGACRALAFAGYLERVHHIPAVYRLTPKGLTTDPTAAECKRVAEATSNREKNVAIPPAADLRLSRFRKKRGAEPTDA